MATSIPTSIPAAYSTDEELESAYRQGWNQGHGIACHNVPELGARLWLESEGRVTVDADNIRDVHQALCFEAESGSRSYSPFEFIAKEYNDREEEGRSEELWEAFEAGTTDAIFADLAEYTDEDYGIEEEAEEEDEEDE